MNCKEARYILLATEAPATPAEAVQQHLADCSRCRKHQRRLLTLEIQLANLARPGESLDARQQVLERIAIMEPTPALLPLSPARPKSSRRLLLTAAVGIAAACLVLAVGAWQALTPDSLVEDPSPTASLVSSLLDHDLRLARLTTVPEQVETLVDMARGLQNEAIRMAHQGQADEAAWLRGLHEQVVARGLLGRARELPDLQRQQLALLLHQQADAAETAARASHSPASEHLQAMSETTRQTSAAILAQHWPAPLPLVAPAHPAGSQLLNALVFNGVRLAEEADPLRRADYCTDIADSLLQSIREASQARQSEAASALSHQLGEVMNRGVSVNLVLAETAGADGPEVERVRARAFQATAALEGVLQKTPAPARAGIEQALEASRKGLAKGKGKGSSHGKGKDFVPPGHVKKGNGHKNKTND